MCGRRSSSLNRLMDAYADSSSKCDASNCETLLHGVSAPGVTLVHAFPPSRVRLIAPSSEPVQIVLTLRHLVILTGEIGTDDVPAVAAGSGLEQNIARVVERVWVHRRENDGRSAKKS